MVVPEDSLKGGLDYITGHVDMSGEVYVIDVGRDVVHDEPLIISTWDEDTSEEDGVFANAVFSDRYMARDFSPDENIRVVYDHDIEVVSGDRIGEYSGVDFFDVDLDQRLEFREKNGGSYRPDDQGLKDLYSLFN